MPNSRRAALAKARQRRVALDRDRAARDARIEQAVARVFLGLEQRAVAERAVHDADVGIGATLRQLLTEHISLQDVADLCDLDTSDVRRLVRHAPVQAPTSSASSAAGVGDYELEPDQPDTTADAPTVAETAVNNHFDEHAVHSQH